jgi:hypothetical protein
VSWGQVRAQLHHAVESQQGGQQSQRPGHGWLRCQFHPNGNRQEDYGPESEESDDDVKILTRPDQAVPVPAPVVRGREPFSVT